MLNVTRIWEAVRATSAASTFFDPIEIADERFADGATSANNPVNEVLIEATCLWGGKNSQEDWSLEDNLKCLVSIGTGKPSMKPFGGNLINIGKALLAIATDTEKAAESFRRRHDPLFKSSRAF